MSTAAVLAEVSNGVACWTLNRPAERNPFSAEIKQALLKLAQEFVADERQKVVIITGAGEFFSAGGDLRVVGSDPSPLNTRRIISVTHAFLRLLHSCEKPVITAVNGGAVGAGVGLAMSGDIVLASDRAWFMSGFPRIGAVPDAGLMYYLTRAVGLPKARDFLLTNRRIDAAGADASGMVSRVVPHDELMAQARALARELAEGPTAATALTKAMLAQTLHDSFDSHLLREDLAQAVAFSTNDLAEGVAALKEKRRPRFQGR
ncbi:enoyl-CoA hydratase/isomerase family protein [Ottowia sp. VDI28]|uniref:enoyl-CoA hydratase/isomerase family protein n=1 Tax=Ottowia sp. VDI28 TaxID=3133968 RepID=UPI003C2BC6C1